ncbi:hypothetical protein QBC38DRAFT_76558 [Podospora fimiseda]|uniref:Ubiquitination network signaling protein acrB n=1 Tax=Podospora fimiseda TaxID=252190 RepID=A0AAN7H6J0_9PEZI|nr:hypothetical protein QBC38DRAFT_76558 [Podospora fimiseda]
MRMPRATSSTKRQQGPTNQRDTRHENGLVGPGKRIVKQKSQNQLETGLKPQGDHAAPAPPVPPLSAATVAANASSIHPDDMAPEHKSAAELLRRGSMGAYSESSSAESLAVNSAQSPIPEETHRRIDVNDAKNAHVHRDTGPLEFAITVLRALPLHDTIAILIILMQASPTVVALIYTLFTCLTFVPTLTTSSGLSIAEIFDGSQGTPAMTTLVFMDIFMLGMWLFLWAPMQQFILDLAQVVIALTLGGGGTSNQGTTGNIVLCVAIVGFSQWFKHVRWNGLTQLTEILGSKRFPVDLETGAMFRGFEKKDPYSWIRNTLAIHILTQGMVRHIREWYLRRERRDSQAPGLLDPEAGKSVSFTAQGSSDVALMAADSDAHLQGNSTNITTKKRRKQSAQVRIRQPLWAAIASTKIVMVKEYELSHAASESSSSNATDIHNLGNAPFNTQPEQIWICYVGCDEVCFNTSHFPQASGSKSVSDEEEQPGVDSSKPFYVRVNNAIWQPTRIIPIDNGDEDKHQGARWAGDIYGLTPLSNYEFEFVSTRTDEVIFSTSVRTVQAKSKDLEVPSKTAGGSRSHARHDSPATTLRASIAAAEAKLADEKARLKTVRKDNNRKLNSTRKEIEKLSSAVQSAGGDDEKLRQKIAQNKVQEKRAEESISELDADLKELEATPEDLLKEYRSKQAAWTEEKAQFDKERAAFKNFKASIDKEMKALEEEKASLQAKRNKIATRIAKVDDEHARITDANARGLNEAERRRQEREAHEAEMVRIEQHLKDRIQTLSTGNIHKQEIAAQMQAYLAGLQEEMAYEAAAPVPPHFPAAATPWGMPPAPFAAAQSVWPSTSMPGPAASLLPPPQMAAYSGALHTGISHTPPHTRVRGRSSSMLSDVSGFTQSTEENEDAGHVAVAGHHHSHGLYNVVAHETPGSKVLRGPPGFHFARQRSDGLGAASGSGSGSGSSVRSAESGSGGSLKEAISPV